MNPKTLRVILLLAAIGVGLWAAQHYWLSDLPAPRGVGQNAGGLMTPVPDLALPDANGNLIRLRDFQGKVLVINFWATWCLPCKLEIPFFNQVYNEYREQGVEFLGISVDAGGWKDIEEFQEEVPIAYPVVLADEKAVEAFGGLAGLPVTIFVDRQGRIVYKNVGITDIDDLRANIQRLL